MDEKIRKTNNSPINSANFISKLFLCWVSPVLETGYKRPLTEEDLYNPISSQESEFLTEQVEKEWKKELNSKKNPSLIRALIRIFGLRIFLLGLLVGIEEISKMAVPFIISNLLLYFDGSIDFRTALIFAFCLCACMTLNSVIHHPYFLQVQLTGMKIRIGCSGVIYKKIFNLKYTDNQATSGQIINMLSNDVSRLEFVPYFLAFLIIGPIEAIIIIVVLIQRVNVYFLAGLALLVLLIPTQSFIGKFNDKIRRIISKKCDKRINLLNEFLNGIKIIKLNCWEIPFKKIIEEFRKRELKYQQYLFYLLTINSTFDLILPSLLTYTSVSFYILFIKSPLAPSFIVLAMSFYMKLNSSMGFFFIKAVTFLISANVSIKRIQNFLMQDEQEKLTDYKKATLPYIKLENVSASWKNESDSFSLKDLNFEIKDNELIAVIGSIGSGKSSLLLTLLNEVSNVKGNLKIDGSVFYLPQEPWVFSASLKQNILFGKTYEREKFNQVIRVCNLEQDLKLLNEKENTIIGEKGVNLSGGQKARVALARAIYSDAQIFLFDDPLSAVDASVSKSIFNDCIRKYLSKKLRILITNHVHCLKDVDRIILLKEGEIKAFGTYEEITNKGIDMDLIVQTSAEESKRKHLASETSVKTMSDADESEVDQEEPEEIRAIINSECNLALSKQTSNTRRTSVKKQQTINEYKETQNIGQLSYKTYVKYFKIGGGLFGTFFFMFTLILSQVLLTLSDYWISNWASSEHEKSLLETKNSSNSSCINCNPNYLKSRFYYFSIHSILLWGGVIATVLRELSFFRICINASKRMHGDMFNSVMTTSLRFFDLNPLGRIMNRFSKDINLLDETLPWTLNDFLQVFMLVMSSITMTTILNYWALIPLVPLGFLFVYIRRYFLRTSVEIKRIESVNRSPIFVHVNNTLSGITIIKAANIKNILINEYNTHTDYHTRAISLFMYVNRWFAVRLDWIAVVFSYIVVFSCIFLKDYLNVNSGQIGIMLVYLCQLLNLFQWTIRQSCECENLMTAVERIQEYSSLPKEPLEQGEIEPSKEWIQNGKIKFENVSFSYAENLPNVLRNLSFEIKPNEKIGIIGRTGAGKSSIIQSLFRMAEPKGLILIDDVNIKKISLHNLRSRLSIIPQEPTLFIGTLRFNLDPFNQHSDDQIWTALENVQLKKFVQEMKGGLNMEITKGGSNLSGGQKQLVNLARAIIKKSKILVIDEATANVDYKTDFLVQKAIRECFHDCTVVTIAHRLRTIIDNNRIICLSNGELKDIGTPLELINNKDSILFDLINSLDKNESKELIQIVHSTQLNKI